MSAGDAAYPLVAVIGLLERMLGVIAQRSGIRLRQSRGGERDRYQHNRKPDHGNLHSPSAPTLERRRA